MLSKSKIKVIIGHWFQELAGIEVVTRILFKLLWMLHSKGHLHMGTTFEFSQIYSFLKF